MSNERLGLGVPRYLPGVVEAMGIAITSPQCPEILHGAIAMVIQEGMGGDRGVSHHLVGIIDAVGITPVSPWQGTEINNVISGKDSDGTSQSREQHPKGPNYQP